MRRRRVGGYSGVDIRQGNGRFYRYAAREDGTIDPFLLRFLCQSGEVVCHGTEETVGTSRIIIVQSELECFTKGVDKQELILLPCRVGA